MIIYFDTETTGLRPGQIAQLSYVIADGEQARGKNFFFTVDSMDYGAYSVHGFSLEKLYVLSNGKRFGDLIEEIESDFCSADLVCAHNTSFDFMFMRKEFERLGKIFAVKREFCSMKKLTPVCKLLRSGGAYKYPKLNEACAHFGITDTEIKQTLNSLYNANASYHDARFDATAVYLLMDRAMNSEPSLRSLKEYL